MVGGGGRTLHAGDKYVGQTLRPDQLSGQYGANKADADKVANVLKKFGLKVESVSLATRSMRVVGTAKAVEAAFKPDMAIVRSARQMGEYRGRQGTLQIPQELRGLVTGIFGIDSPRTARRKSHSTTPSPSLSPLSPADL